MRLDPELNFENIPKWKAFFNRQAEEFGVILSRDVEFAHKQLWYRNHSVISEEDGKIKLDFSKVDEVGKGLFEAPVYISVRNDAPPFECEGGVMTEYETRKDFKNYCIDRNKGQSIIYLKNKQ
ncbi:MAG: hypothetical protein IJB70_08910 [Clostridia bacterium]|nr:hypothetical protein [Clostridia bacterium]